MLTRIALLLAFALLPACGGDDPSVSNDSGTDALPCTSWGCQDNGAYGCTMICLSYAPQDCPQGPWPCGAKPLLK